MSNIVPLGSGNRVIPLPVATGIASVGGAGTTAGVCAARDIVAQPSTPAVIADPKRRRNADGLFNVDLRNRLALSYIERQSGEIHLSRMVELGTLGGGNLAILEHDALDGATRETVDYADSTSPDTLAMLTFRTTGSTAAGGAIGCTILHSRLKPLT
jgi:hypothetical protein